MGHVHASVSSFLSWKLFSACLSWLNAEFHWELHGFFTKVSEAVNYQNSKLKLNCVKKNKEGTVLSGKSLHFIFMPVIFMRLTQLLQLQLCTYYLNFFLSCKQQIEYKEKCCCIFVIVLLKDTNFISHWDYYNNWWILCGSIFVPC